MVRKEIKKIINAFKKLLELRIQETAQNIELNTTKLKEVWREGYEQGYSDGYKDAELVIKGGKR